jgi:hypothetical protein
MSDKRLVGIEIVIKDGVKTTTSSYADKNTPEDVTETKIEVEEHTGKIETSNISNK